MTDTPEPPMDNDRLEDLARRLEKSAVLGNNIHNPWPQKLLNEAAQAIRSLLADSAAKDAELAKTRDQRDYWRGRDKAGLEIEQELRAALAEARRVIELIAVNTDNLAARTFLQENPNDAG